MLLPTPLGPAAAGPSWVPSPDAAAELSRLVRAEWQTWSGYSEALDELRALREAADAREADIAAADSAARAAERREAAHLIQPDKSYWRNEDKEPGRWPSS